MTIRPECFLIIRLIQVKRISSALISTSVRALAQSMTTNTMVALARRIFPDYDLYARSGFPRSIAIPNNDAARQIVRDIVQADSFLDFVLLLVEIGDQGLMGRKYAIPYMREIISGVYDLGFLYDSANGMFVENSEQSITRNWGALRQGQEYTFCFMRLDIAGNSVIVRENSPEAVRETYDTLRDLTQKAVLRRNGRIWGWDGDGGLATFFFGNKNQSAVMAGREVLHELFFYNRIACPLTKPFQVRVAVHTGTFDYSPDEEELKASETIKRVMDIEANYTKPGTMTVSPVTKLMLDAIASSQLQPFTGRDQLEYYNYQLSLETP